MDLIDREKALGCFWAYEDGDETDMPAYDRLQALPIVAEAEDCISRQDAINALWKALYEYEDKTEKQFQESDELDVADWIMHRNFVQNMSDIDRQTILNLPSAQPVAREIGYAECANAMLKMWIDNVLTDGEYNRIMDKLNKYWGKANA